MATGKVKQKHYIEIGVEYDVKKCTYLHGRDLTDYVHHQLCSDTNGPYAINSVVVFAGINELSAERPARPELASVENFNSLNLPLIKTLEERERKRYKLLETVAAISGDFYADSRFNAWRDKYGDHLEGSVGIYRFLIDVSEKAEKSFPENWETVDQSFFEAQEAIVDEMYAWDPWEINDNKRIFEFFKKFFTVKT